MDTPSNLRHGRRCGRHLSAHAARHDTSSTLASIDFFPGQQTTLRPTLGQRRRVIWHRLGIVGLLAGVRFGGLALWLRIYRGVLLGHVRGDGPKRRDQPRIRIILSAGELVDLAAAMTDPARIV